jgi:hypothetical protein
LASQFVQLPYPPESAGTNSVQLPFAPTSGSSNYIKFPQGVNPIPAIVRAYVTNAGITNPAEITAVTNFYNSMVSNSLWSLFDRIWLISPTSLNAATYDLVTGTAQLTLVNSPVLNTNFGLEFNGTSQYAQSDQNLSVYTNYNATSYQGNISIYVTVNNTNPANPTLVDVYGSIRVSNSANFLSFVGPTATFATNVKATTASNASHASTSIKNGFFSTSRNSQTSLTLYQNGSSLATSSTSGTPGTTFAYPIVFGAAYSTGSVIGYSSVFVTAFTIGGALTSGQQATFSTIVNTLMTALSRNVY